MTVLLTQCKYREEQLDFLSSYIQPELGIYAPALVVEGPPSSGKSYTLKSFLATIEDDVDSIYINCDLCVFLKVVLQRIMRYMIEIFDMDYSKLHESVVRCDTFSNFVEVAKQLIKMRNKKLNKQGKRQKHIVLVLDHVDKVQLGFGESLKEMTYSLSRLQEQNVAFEDLTVVYSVNRWDVTDSTTEALPIVLFERYTIDQVKDILQNKFQDDKWIVNVKKDLEKTQITWNEFEGFKNQFISIIIDVFQDLFGSDIDMIFPVLTKTWPLFYKPLISYGKYEQGTNDLLSLFKQNREILKTEYGISTTVSLIDEPINSETSYDLSKMSKYLLIATYLASFNEPKHDLLHFTKEKELRSHRKFRIGKRRKSHKGELGLKMLLPQPFHLERLLAIYKAIIDQNDLSSSSSANKNQTDIQLLGELANLASLKLVSRLAAGDSIGGTAKWRCNLNFNVVQKFCNDLNFQIEHYLDEEP